VTDPVDECNGDAECKWNPQYSRRWEEAVDAAPWDGEMKILDCPRCGHRMTVDAGAATTDALREAGEAVEEPAVAAALEDLAGRIEDDDELVGAHCNCRIEHTGHPTKPDDRRWGCGQAGAIRVPK
jgi:hypothetical protein